MKENRINRALIFLASAFLPSLFVATVYFVSTAKAVSHIEALESGYVFALWFFFVLGVVRLFSGEEIDLRGISFFPVAVTGLAIAGLLLGFGNQTILMIISGVGMTLALFIAHLIREDNQGKYAEHWFVLISIVGNCVTSLASGLALNDKLNLINEFDYLLRLLAS